MRYGFGFAIVGFLLMVFVLGVGFGKNWGSREREQEIYAEAIKNNVGGYRGDPETGKPIFYWKRVGKETNDRMSMEIKCDDEKCLVCNFDCV